MASGRRLCRNKPDLLGYICGEYTIAPKRKTVTSFITCAYHDYFGIKLADPDKPWAPHMVSKVCTEALSGWTNGKRSVNFGISIVWRELTNHVNDWYFCAVDVTGINRKNRGSVKYPDLQLEHRPVTHCDEMPESIFGKTHDISDEDASRVEGQEDEDEEVVL